MKHGNYNEYVWQYGNKPIDTKHILRRALSNKKWKISKNVFTLRSRPKQKFIIYLHWESSSLNKLDHLKWMWWTNKCKPQKPNVKKLFLSVDRVGQIKHWVKSLTSWKIGKFLLRQKWVRSGATKWHWQSNGIFRTRSLAIVCVKHFIIGVKSISTTCTWNMLSLLGKIRLEKVLQFEWQHIQTHTHIKKKKE